MKRSWMISLPLALVLILVIAGIASAHEHREVGKYTFIVGWLNEPAFVNGQNSIDLRVSNTETKEPVTGLDKTIKAQVMYGGDTVDIPLKARYNTPGAYNGYLFPTKSGTYIFHFTGTIEGTTIDEKFESGPNTFSDMEDTTPLQFPVKLTAPAQVSSDLEAAQAQVALAQAAAQQAQTFGIIGIVVGVIGIAVGGFALVRRK